MKKYGQSIIEYVLIAVLVILGIVIMGTYVLRSTNAHFKLLDTGVQDSFREVLVQAPQSSIPNIPLNCTCTDAALGCSLSTGTSQCTGDQQAYSHTCNISKCDGQASSYCKHDDTCCKVPYKVGCGTIPIPSTGVPTQATAPCPAAGTTLPSGTVIPIGFTYPTGTTCPTVSQGTSTTAANCYYGQQIEATQCSDLPIICVPDATCNATCTGVSLIAGTGSQASALYCANQSTTMPTGMDQNYPISYVASATHCPAISPSTLCVMYCNEASGFLPFTSTGGVTSCIDQFPIAQELNNCTGEPNILSTAAACTSSTTPCCYYDGAYYTVNNQDFTICPSDNNIAIKTANLTTASSVCTSCGCCTDKNSNCIVSALCATQPSGPGCTCSTQTADFSDGCDCTINMTVSNV